MKIAFFVTGLDSGGLENYLLRFLKYKYQSFNKIVIYCKGGKTGQLEESFLAIENLIIINSKISFFNFSHYYNLYKFFKNEKFNVVCDFTGNFAGMIMLISNIANIENRIAFYRGASNHFKSSIFKIVYNNLVKSLTYRNATSILSNSYSAFKFFYPKVVLKNEKRFKVIYNGININEFEINKNENLRTELNLPENSFVVGHTGRYNYAKNHLMIIQVAEKLIHKYSDIYFILCGNGVKEYLLKEIVKKGLEKRFLLFENRNDIPLFLNTMDAYIFPSITEGQPNSLIEAMITGLPFVASNIDSIKETVGEKYYTNLCDPSDVNEFSDKIEKLYIDRKSRDFELKNWATKKFNHIDLFEKFYNVIYEKYRKR
ncbi:glycosyltransferase [Chryseobacterium sp. POE27]|uniref:glycosyltransferase n=1 Tax=Chryseobacterium sp. POE27 TaxID=3138177 RepID=UPI00321BD416